MLPRDNNNDKDNTCNDNDNDKDNSKDNDDATTTPRNVISSGESTAVTEPQLSKSPRTVSVSDRLVVRLAATVAIGRPPVSGDSATVPRRRDRYNALASPCTCTCSSATALRLSTPC